MPTLLACVFLPCFCLQQTNCFSMCSPHVMLSLTINLVPIFTVFASLKYPCFQTEGKEPGSLCFWPLIPGCLIARIPGFHPRLPRFLFLDRKLESLFRTAHCCFSEISTGSSVNDSHFYSTCQQIHDFCIKINPSLFI